MALSQLEMVLRGKPNLRMKFHTMASPKISRRACLGKPRSIHSWWSVECKLVDHVLVGDIKMALEWRSLRIFFQKSKDFRTHVVPTSVCATWGVHTLRVARTFSLHFFLAWLTDIAYTHGSRCLRCARHISPSHLLPSHVSSTVFAVPARSLRHLVPVCTFLAELFPIRTARVKRTSLRAARSLATWPIPRHSTGYEPKEFDNIGDTTPINDPNYDNISDFSKKTHARTLDCSVFSQCLNPLFRTFLMVKAKTACTGKPIARQREREGSVISVA